MAYLSGEDYYVPAKSTSDRFEDGTISFLDIVALNHSFDAFYGLTGGMQSVQQHTFGLARFTYIILSSLRHGNGRPLAQIYAHGQFDSPGTQGPILSFNLLNAQGEIVGYSQVDRMASLYNIHVRTGCFCNTGACQAFLGISDEQMKRNLQAGHVCGDDVDLVLGQPTGSVRVSFGYMSTFPDCQNFLRFVVECFAEGPVTVDRERIGRLTSVTSPRDSSLQPIARRNGEIQEEEETERQEEREFGQTECTNHREEGCTLTNIYVYPVKSCGAFEVQQWPLGDQGLLFDRGWMVVNVNGVCLSQKREPRLCLIKPEIHLSKNQLQLHATGMESISVPLETKAQSEVCQSKVCGDRVETLDCGEAAAQWLSYFLKQKCRLIRLSPDFTRDAKRKKQQEPGQGEASSSSRLSLVNEAQYLMINRGSVELIHQRIHNSLPSLSFSDLSSLTLSLSPSSPFLSPTHSFSLSPPSLTSSLFQPLLRTFPLFLLLPSSLLLTLSLCLLPLFPPCSLHLSYSSLSLLLPAFSLPSSASSLSLSYSLSPSHSFTSSPLPLFPSLSFNLSSLSLSFSFYSLPLPALSPCPSFLPFLSSPLVSLYPNSSLLLSFTSFSLSFPALLPDPFFLPLFYFLFHFIPSLSLSHLFSLPLSLLLPLSLHFLSLSPTSSPYLSLFYFLLPLSHLFSSFTLSLHLLPLALLCLSTSPPHHHIFLLLSLLALSPDPFSLPLFYSLSFTLFPPFRTTLLLTSFSFTSSSLPLSALSPSPAASSLLFYRSLSLFHFVSSLPYPFFLSTSPPHLHLFLLLLLPLPTLSPDPLSYHLFSLPLSLLYFLLPCFHFVFSLSLPLFVFTCFLVFLPPPSPSLSPPFLTISTSVSLSPSYQSVPFSFSAPSVSLPPSFALSSPSVSLLPLFSLSSFRREQSDPDEPVLDVENVVRRFRANLLVSGAEAFQEDLWSELRIADARFTVSGPCGRCHMVGIDQETGAKTKEPLLTLSAYRNTGKVTFGVYLSHLLPRDSNVTPVLRVGSRVLPRSVPS